MSLQEGDRFEAYKDLVDKSLGDPDIDKESFLTWLKNLVHFGSLTPKDARAFARRARSLPGTDEDEG